MNEQDVEVCVYRPNQGDEFEIEITAPATASEPKRRVCVALSAADLMLAIGGRGGIKGKLRVMEFKRAKRKDGAK